MKHKYFDVLVWLIVPIQVGALFTYLFTVKEFISGLDLLNLDTHSILTLAGWTTVMGVMNGVLGMAVGHELGHRQDSWQRFAGKILTWTCLRMSFYIEHNWGHHKLVGRPDDPNTARRNEPIYTYIFRSLTGTWYHAWGIQKELNERRGVGFFSIYNDLFWFTIIQWGSIITVALALGWRTAIFYVVAAILGMLLLESVNYLEHYGLERKQLPNGNYERVAPIHSWNTNHTFSSAALFNLSRHSDHHFIADKRYQILKNYKEEAPNLPMGYAGMIFLSFVPPLYFYIMNKKIDKVFEVHDRNSKLAIN